MIDPNQPQMNPGPAKSGAVRAFLQRKVSLPMWSLIVIGAIVLIAFNSNSSKASNPPATPSGSGASSVAKPSQTPKTPAPTATPTHVPQWTVVQSFTGSGSKKTAIFSAPDDWRIVWTCNPASFFGGSYNVIVSVNNADSTPLDYAAVNTMCKSGYTGDMTEEHQGGSVYLDINCEGDWTMQIEVLK